PEAEAAQQGEAQHVRADDAPGGDACQPFVAGRDGGEAQLRDLEGPLTDELGGVLVLLRLYDGPQSLLVEVEAHRDRVDARARVGGGARFGAVLVREHAHDLADDDAGVTRLPRLPARVPSPERRRGEAGVEHRQRVAGVRVAGRDVALVLGHRCPVDGAGADVGVERAVWGPEARERALVRYGPVRVLDSGSALQEGVDRVDRVYDGPFHPVEDRALAVDEHGGHALTVDEAVLVDVGGGPLLGRVPRRRDAGVLARSGSELGDLGEDVWSSRAGRLHQV